MANPIYARLQATAQRLIAKYGPGVARRWGQAPGLSPPRPPPGRLRAAVSTRLFGLNPKPQSETVQSLQRRLKFSIRAYVNSNAQKLGLFFRRERRACLRLRAKAGPGSHSMASRRACG
ncbi:hypothetical protein GOB17_30840 [Sinorhizobium meliloti]|nr:hypothetical protein [Sinorhizobium meliloti]MDX0301131.1 hypothetical protein [Sinorhizobium meliloti]